MDGEGEAGRDLLPGSDFLKELNSRPLPADLRVLTVEGRALPVGPDDLRPYVESALARAVLREDGVAWVEGLIEAAASALGDGAVPAGSVPLMGATEHAVLDADHRSMLKRVPAMAAVRSVFGAEDGPPPGIEFLLERSGDDLPPDDGAFVRTLETTARERLRKPAFSTSWAEGSSLSADALVALAVAEEPAEKRQALG